MQKVKIKSIKKVKIRDRYDLTIDSNHNFFANGILIHNTSFWVSNVLVKKKLNIFKKALRLIGINIADEEYDYVYGSRKVVKNEYETRKKNDFYEYDLWGEIKDKIKDNIPKGFSVYGEYVGFTKNGGQIQGGYDYGCNEGEGKILVYRVTYTNRDGQVFNLSTEQIKEFCDRAGLEYVHLFYSGLAKNLFRLPTKNHWHEKFYNKLEEKYTDKDCFICNNKVPEEGIVLRKESLFNFEAYKLKSFRFYEHERDLLDKGEEDIESLN